MQRLEVSGAARPIYGSLGVKRLIWRRYWNKQVLKIACWHFSFCHDILFSAIVQFHTQTTYYVFCSWKSLSSQQKVTKPWARHISIRITRATDPHYLGGEAGCSLFEIQCMTALQVGWLFVVIHELWRCAVVSWSQVALYVLISCTHTSLMAHESVYLM